MPRTNTLVLLMLILAASPASASQLVKEFTGKSSVTTVAFEVDSPWIMDWVLNADYDQLVALDITLIDAKTGRHVGRVLHTKRKGNGIKLFYEAGSYQLRISATLARWRIKIEQLSDEEAELYVPKGVKPAAF